MTELKISKFTKALILSCTLASSALAAVATASASGSVLGSSSGLAALPSWTEFRLLTDAEREPIHQAVLEILGQVTAQPFSNGKIRFCVADNELWETSPTASCESTRSTAARYAWPLVLTSASESFAWMAYSRFLTQFCQAKIDPAACSKLQLRNAPDFKLENLDGAWFNLLERIHDILIPRAHADASEIPDPVEAAETLAPVCKIQDGEMRTKAGTTIFFDFGPQPAPAHSKLLTEIAVIAADATAPEGAVGDGLSKLRAMGKPLTLNFQKKSVWVSDRVSRDKARWIGVEKTEAELGDKNGQKFAAAFDQMKSQLKNRRTLSSEIQEALTVGACPGASPCAWLKSDKIRRAAVLVPLESESLKGEQLQLERTARGIFDGLEDLVVSKRLTANELTLLRREYANLLLASEIPTVATRNRLRRLFAVPEVSKAMVELVDGIILMKKNSIAQDRAVAAAALARSDSGIVSLRTQRRDSIVAAFEDVCEGPKPGPASKGKATTKGKAPAKPKTAQPTAR